MELSFTILKTSKTDRWGQFFYFSHWQKAAKICIFLQN